MKWFRKFGRLIVAIILAISGSFGLYALTKRVFTIDSIEVVGTQIDVSINEQKINKNLLFFPTENVRLQLLKDNPIIKDVQIRKKFPHTLVIVAYARTPIARLEFPLLSVLVDRDGVVLGQASLQDSSLPLLRLDIPQVNPGNMLTDPRLRQSLTFLSSLNEDIHIAYIAELDNQSLRAKADKLDIYFPQNGTIVSKVATLQTLTSGFRIKGILPKVIDLRFDKPVVTFY